MSVDNSLSSFDRANQLSPAERRAKDAILRKIMKSENGLTNAELLEIDEVKHNPRRLGKCIGSLVQEKSIERSAKRKYVFNRTGPRVDLLDNFRDFLSEKIIQVDREGLEGSNILRIDFNSPYCTFVLSTDQEFFSSIKRELPGHRVFDRTELEVTLEKASEIMESLWEKKVMSELNHEEQEIIAEFKDAIASSKRFVSWKGFVLDLVEQEEWIKVMAKSSDEGYHKLLINSRKFRIFKKYATRLVKDEPKSLIIIPSQNFLEDPRSYG